MGTRWVDHRSAGAVAGCRCRRDGARLVGGAEGVSRARKAAIDTPELEAEDCFAASARSPSTAAIRPGAGMSNRVRAVERESLIPPRFSLMPPICTTPRVHYF